MPYTPVELRHVRIGRALLGYKRTAVQSLLNELADSFETVWRERHELADRVEEMEDELETLRGREQALTHALVAAEQAAAHVKEQAEREAQVIVAEAHAAARSITRDAEGTEQRLRGEVRRIEALLRAALGTIDETSPEQPQFWPRREDAAAPEAELTPEADEPREAAPAQPALRKVSGGFEWVEDR
jgi:cell division initiation protein